MSRRARGDDNAEEDEGEVLFRPPPGAAAAGALPKLPTQKTERELEVEARRKERFEKNRELKKAQRALRRAQQFSDAERAAKAQGFLESRKEEVRLRLEREAKARARKQHQTHAKNAKKKAKREAEKAMKHAAAAGEGGAGVVTGKKAGDDAKLPRGGELKERGN